MRKRLAIIAVFALVTALASLPAEARPYAKRATSGIQTAPAFDVAAIPPYPTEAMPGAAPAGRGLRAAKRSRTAVRSRGDVNASPRGSQRETASTSRSCLTADTRAILERGEAHFGVRFQIVSTCRPGAFIAGTRHLSEHSRGRAVDLLVPRGVSKQAVVRWFFANSPGVTMVYCGMAHVHFDTGPYHALACGGCGQRRAKVPTQHRVAGANRAGGS